MAQVVNASLLELAETISTRAKALHECLEKNKLEQPSLLKDDSPVEYLEKGDADIQKVRLELRSAAQQLDALAAGKAGWMMDQSVCRLHDANVHRLFYMYAVPKHVPSQGSISYKDLAQKTGLDEDKLTRIVRYALLNFVFIEPQPGYVAHSVFSRMLLEDEKAWGWYGHLAEDCYGGVSRTVEAYEKWGSASQVQTETGMQLYLNTTSNLFNWMTENAPERIARFGEAMEYAAEATMSSVFSWDWTTLGKATVVDLGGSFGHKSIAIARRAPELTFIVQDLESTISKVPPPPAEVADRIQFEAQDFFTPQRRRDMDVVFMARVLHDWPDADCHRIFQNLVPAMKPGCRLILNEWTITLPYELPTAEDKMVRVFDLHMMTLVNARERSIDEWKKVVAEGSEGKLEYEWHTSGLVCFIKR